MDLGIGPGIGIDTGTRIGTGIDSNVSSIDLFIRYVFHSFSHSLYFSERDFKNSKKVREEPAPIKNHFSLLRF
jgi:hypothetical protein